MNLNCVIIDDEPLAQELLKSYVEKTPILNLIGVYSNPLLAMKDLVGKALESDRVKVFANNKSVSRVAVCSGSGGSVLRDAYLAGADTLVTGEVKYNNELDAAEYGVNLIVAGHKETERIVLPVIKDIILKGFPSAEVFVYYA